MLDTVHSRIYARVRTHSLRAFLAHFYTTQISGDTQAVFEACFVLQRDARWCRRRVRCLIPDVHQVLWPPMTARPDTDDFPVIQVAPCVYVPVVPRFMDPTTLRRCLAMYNL